MTRRTMPIYNEYPDGEPDYGPLTDAQRKAFAENMSHMLDVPRDVRWTKEPPLGMSAAGCSIISPNDLADGSAHYTAMQS